ncbi:unnamed protein product [Effrenium voratum]|uniref:Uncharacterized protein n=1 Tax=Effrenium voratum TaxID=2562239 RepID=A0AA36MKH9_9DINO|nr:unnamed protein product [Effrenium voratum]
MAEKGMEKEAEKAAKVGKEVKPGKKVPKWLTELDDLGLVVPGTYRDFIDIALEKGALDEARTWAEKAREEGNPLTPEDLQSLINKALTKTNAEAAKLWLEEALKMEELSTQDKMKTTFLAVFLVARKLGFGVLRDLLEEGGEEPSRWLRNKARLRVFAARNFAARGKRKGTSGAVP